MPHKIPSQLTLPFVFRVTTLWFIGVWWAHASGWIGSIFGILSRNCYRAAKQVRSAIVKMAESSAHSMRKTSPGLWQIL
jgi:hypothetical protein